MRIRAYAAVPALGLILGLSGSKTALGAPAAVASTDESSGALAEIVVTAEHVQANAQTTPIAMSVYGSADVKLDAITNVANLSAIAPDLNFADIQGAPVITIRGISSRDTTEVGDPAVTVNVDGFYQNRPYALDATLYDVDRIEILRGPQGTLNGRNSVGGAINVITAAPSKTFAAYTSVQYGNFNEMDLQGMVNVPVNDQLQVRTAFLSVSHDGYRNNSPQPSGDEADNKSVRLEAAFQPAANLSGLVTFQYTSEGGAGDVSENIPFIYKANGALDTNLPPGIDANQFYVGTAPALRLSDKMFRFKFDYDLDYVMLTALGGYDELAWHHATDDSNPYSNPSVYEFQQNEFPQTINGEFRVTSKTVGAFKWQAGVYYFHEGSRLVSADAAPLANGTFNEYFGFKYSTSDHSHAGYAQGSYEFTEALKLTAGLRYTSDFKGESGFYGNLTAGFVYANQIGSASSSKTTYHVALDYKATEANFLYAKVDTGYKEGGFNFGGAAYAPETVTAYEIGSKNRFLDGALQLNFDGFYDNYTNEQVGTFAFLANGNPVQLTENAGASHIYGAESDLIAKVSMVGTLNVSVDYLHARYTNFLSVSDPSDPKASGNVQLAGNAPPQSPTWSAAVGLEHGWPVAGGELIGRIQSKLQSSSYFSFYNSPDTRQPAFTMSDAFLTYAAAAAHWKVTALVRNVTDEKVFTNAEENQYANSYAYQFYPPRTYGLRFEYTW